MHSHWKIVCKECGVTISQCRCPDDSQFGPKEKRYSTCDECFEKLRIIHGGCRNCGD